MTVTTSTARVVHNGNGTTTQFAVPFRFLENAQVAVFLRDAAGGQTLWVENTQYTLSGADEAAGGTLTVNTSPTDYTPAAGEKLVIVRAVPITQETDYVENDPFPAETHERALDKATMINQEQAERLDRTFTIPETDSFAGSFVLPVDTERANMFQAYGPLGEPAVAAGTSADLTPVSGFVNDNLLGAGTAAVFLTGLGVTGYAQSLLDDADATAARATLGLDDAVLLAAPSAGDAGKALAVDNAGGAVEYQLYVPRGYIDGLTLSNNGVAPTTDIDIAAGIARADNDAATLRGTATITVSMNATGANGLDTGFNGANTVYYIWLIGDASGTEAVAGLASMSGSAPSMPAGYDLKALAGAVSTDGASAIIADQFTQRKLGRTVFVSAEQTIAASALVALAHGLGVEPETVTIELVCTTAEFNYSVGDHLVASPVRNGLNAGNHLSVRKDGTDITIRYGDAVGSTSVFSGSNAATGASVVLTDGSWNMVVKAST